MKALKSLGLVLIAIVAVAAVSTASASATEYPKFETEKGGLDPFSSEPASGESVLIEWGDGSRYECKKGMFTTGKFESGSHEIPEVTVTFKECPFTTPGQETGVLKTKVLAGRLVELSNGKLGIALRPKSGTTFAEFSGGSLTCSGAKCEWRGELVGELTEKVSELEAFKRALKLLWERGPNTGEPRWHEYSFLGTKYTSAQLSVWREGTEWTKTSWIEAQTTLKATESFRIRPA